MTDGSEVKNCTCQVATNRMRQNSVRTKKRRGVVVITASSIIIVKGSIIDQFLARSEGNAKMVVERIDGQAFKSGYLSATVGQKNESFFLLSLFHFPFSILSFHIFPSVTLFLFSFTECTFEHVYEIPTPFPTEMKETESIYWSGLLWFVTPPLSSLSHPLHSLPILLRSVLYRINPSEKTMLSVFVVQSML